MNLANNKKEYFAPKIVNVVLDNEISLALESEPPIGPGESQLLTPEFLKQDPFKNQLG